MLGRARVKHASGTSDPRYFSVERKGLKYTLYANARASTTPYHAPYRLPVRSAILREIERTPHISGSVLSAAPPARVCARGEKTTAPRGWRVLRSSRRTCLFYTLLKYPTQRQRQVSQAMVTSLKVKPQAKRAAWPLAPTRILSRSRALNRQERPCSADRCAANRPSIRYTC